MNLSKQRARLIVVAFCLVAALRVFVFAAAFPFFNNVDEQAHVDLVVKYSHGEIPRGIEPFSSEAAVLFAIYSTPEYFTKPEQYGRQFPAPNWLLSGEELRKVLNDEVPFWQSRLNHESGEPPLYYAIAGCWFNLGRAFGLHGLPILYWVRFLDVGFAAILVWLGFAAARSTFPNNQFVQLGAAMLLAVWPQTSFYSIQGDALSALCFGIAFLGLIKLFQAEKPGTLVAGWTGLAVAGACLVKTSNLPLPVITTVVLAAKIYATSKKENLRAALIALAVFVLCFSVPIGIWFAWNQNHFGDLTATNSKIELLGWTQKPFGEWWSHPIFTMHGLKVFWLDVIATFWRGEFVWGLERMASPSADAFYAISSTIVILAAAVLLLRRKTQPPERSAKGQIRYGEGFILWLALLSFLSIVAFLVLLSMSFDFGNCPYPSREHPYFTSGRLLNAAAVPFFLLFVYVIDQFAKWLKRDWLRWTLLGATLLVVLISQLQTNAPAFASRYNFFHRKAL